MPLDSYPLAKLETAAYRLKKPPERIEFTHQTALDTGCKYRKKRRGN